MSTVTRQVLLEVGYFIDVLHGSVWKTAYITAHNPAQAEVSVLTHQQGRSELLSLDVPVSDCLPVFLNSKNSTDSYYSRNEFLRMLLSIITPDRLLSMLDSVKTVVSASTEHLIQVYLCFIPMCELIPRDERGINERFDLLVSLGAIYLTKAKESLSTGDFQLVLDTWTTFKTSFSHIIRDYTYVIKTASTLPILQKHHYFELICSLLNCSNCPSNWVQDLADLSFLWLAPQKDLRVELLAGYRFHSRPDNIESLWRAGSNRQSQSCFLFIKPLEKVFESDISAYVAYFRELVCTALRSAITEIQISGIRLLRDAVIEKKPYGADIFKSKEVIFVISNDTLSSAVAAELSQIFNELIGKSDLQSFLHACGTAASSFNQPAIVFPMIEKKDWASLEMMIGNGLRLSCFAGNQEAVNLLVYCAVGRTIPVHLFQSMVDVEVHPLIDVYYLLMRRYSKSDQMQMLASMAPSHKSILPKVSTLPRGSAEVGEMLLQVEFYNPRIQIIWLLKRQHFTQRLPSGLIRCIVLEFAYPINCLYTLAVHENLPLSSCHAGFNGIEVDIVREALTLAEWKYHENFDFVCASQADHYDAIFGGLALTSSSYQENLEFSVPTLAGGLCILVSQNINDTFTTYLGVLDYSLWLTILGISLLVAFILWFFERGNVSVPKDFLNGMKEAIWISLTGFVLVNNYRIKRDSSRVLLLSYWLFSSMCICLFFACNARNYLIGLSPIHSPETLKGQRVLTCETCVDSITQFGPLLLDFRVSQSNFDTAVSMLRSGEADALVFDYDFVEGKTSALCDLVIVSQQFAMFYYVVQMNVVPELKAALDKGLSLLRETTNLKKLEEQYLHEDGQCNAYKYDLKPVTFLNMIELWIVWISALAFSFVLRSGIKRALMLRSHNVHQLELQALVNRSEIRILKHTEVFIHNMTQHVVSIFARMEKAVKKQNFLQQKSISTMQNLSAKLNQEISLD